MSQGQITRHGMLEILELWAYDEPRADLRHIHRFLPHGRAEPKPGSRVPKLGGGM